MQLTYKTIIGNSYAELKERGSKFHGYAIPVSSVDEVKKHLLSLKKEHPKAVHYCYAYRIGTEGLEFRANDDGEPSGSAGRPILGQIDSAGLLNVLVVVVRYFGGTLLGVPGLINAYKTTASESLAQASKIEKNIEYKITLEYDYAIMNDVMQILKQSEATIYKQEVQLFCLLEAGLPLIHKETCLAKLKEIKRLEFK